MTTTDALANWQWLVPLPARDEAVVLVAPTDTSAVQMTHGFGRTRCFDPTAAGHAALFGTRWAAEFADGSLDCVAVPDADRQLSGWPSPQVVVSRIHRSLRPGAGLYVAAEAIRRGESGSRLGGLLPSRHETLLRRAGFSRFWRYYMVHSPSLPRHLVPIERRALLAWDRTMESAGPQSHARRALIRSGLHALLFRYRLIIARA